MKRMKIMAILVAVGSVMGAQAGLVNGTFTSKDVLQGNFEAGGSSVFLENNSNARRAGTGGGGGAQRVNQPVLGFTLPTLGAGETVSAATFSFTLDSIAVTGAPLGFELVISLMNQTSSAGFSGSDFMEGTSALDTSLGNGIVIAQIGTGDVANNSVESFTLTGAALSQFQGLYTAGTPSQTEVWFRLSTSAAIDTTVEANDNDRFNLKTVGGGTGDPIDTALSITTIPEPATLGLIAVFGGGVIFIRRRFMI